MTDPENETVAALLNGLRPSAPSDKLLRRLAAARPVLRLPTMREKVILFVPRIATAAALIALGSALVYKFYPRGGKSTDVIAGNTPSAPSLKAMPVAAITPMQMRQRLIGVQDLGITRDAQQNPVRLMRASWWDDETFAAPNGAPPVRQERLRDEIVPVAVSTF